MCDTSPFMKIQIFGKKLITGYSISFFYFGLRKILKPDSHVDRIAMKFTVFVFRFIIQIKQTI